MSHFKERKDKNCLNCNAVVYGRYCHLCAQENVEPKETFGHLVTHFIYDVTHFDGKFFSSVKFLLLKPGFLSAEYIRGKRMSYLNPIKMYVFISAFFFLFFFSVMKPTINTTRTKTKAKTSKEARAKIEERIEMLQETQKEKETPEYAKQIIKEQIAFLQQDLNTLKKDTSHLSALNYYTVESIDVVPGKYKDLNNYDSVQKTLSPAQRDDWLNRVIKKKKIELDNKYGKNKNELIEKLFEKFFHFFPQVLFVSLPLFALILKLLYIRRKNYYYADHIIYTVHLYCATFIFMFLLMGMGKLDKLDYLHWLKFFMALISIYIVWYQYKSLRNFYKQRRAKTLLKFVLLLNLSSALMLFLFSIFFIFSLFTV